MDNTYETPELTELGSLTDLTELGKPKFAGFTDGYSYNGVDIGEQTDPPVGNIS